MTRINLCHPTFLTDQHLMAEYREMNMVPAALLRTMSSIKRNFNGSPLYTLNGGHVRFFYNKGRFLQRRYNDLIEELRSRGYNLDSNRLFNYTPWERMPELAGEYNPTQEELLTNVLRIHHRVMDKPHWYRIRGTHLQDDNLWLTSPTNWTNSQLEDMLYLK